MLSIRLGTIQTRFQSKNAFFEKIKSKSLKSVLELVKDPGLKLKIKSGSDKLRDLTFIGDTKNNDKNLYRGNFSFEYKEFPNRDSITDAEEYWRKTKVFFVISPNLGYFAIIGAQDDRVRTALMNFVSLICDNTPLKNFIPNNKSLEVLFASLIEKEDETIGRVDLIRSIFRNVKLDNEVLEEMNLKAKNLQDSKNFMKIRNGSKIWYAATYKLFKIGENIPITLRIDRYSKLLIYVDDPYHWIVSYILNLIFNILADLA